MTPETHFLDSTRLTEYFRTLKEKLPQLAFLFLAYLSTARFGNLIFQNIDQGPALIWPAAGISIAGLYLSGYSIWPAVTFASLLTNYLNGSSITVSIIIALANTAQALVGAHILKTFGFERRLDRLWDILVLFMTAFLASAVSPTLGLAGVAVFSNVSQNSLPASWVSWWMGGVLSVTVLTPLITSWIDSIHIPKRRKTIEATAAFLTIAGINYILFFTQHNTLAGIPLVYTTLLPLFWICLRFKPKYVVIGVFLTTILSISGVLYGYERNLTPESEVGVQLMSIEVFSIIISMIFYILSAVYAERKKAERNLKDYVMQLEQALETIRQHALHDILTGLPNRKSMEERFGVTKSLATRHGHKVAMLFLDLDQFKNVNDTLGHSVGDMVLKEVSSRLQNSIRQVDTVARLGGDEFIIILSEIQQTQDIENVAQKVLQSFNEPLSILEHEIQTSTSIGIAVYPEAGEDINDLLRSADIALYRAKDKGRNQYQFYDLDMKNQLHAKISLEHDLRHAIDNQQLRLVYQPYVDIQTDKIKGVEALIRWNHPILGLLSPKDFIPLAEDTGLINQIGLWVLNRACKQIKQWKKQGILLPVSINLSAKQFFGNNLVESIANALEKYELSPADLDLEITETVAMQTMYTSDQLQELVRMGVSISMDDFGTGYSSLGSIRTLYLNRLKIDKAFVNNLMKDPQDEAIIKTIISMGHTLGLRICAEGIETVEQKEILKGLGCDSGQGYLFYKPMEGVDIVKAVELERFVFARR